jgi:CO/xanthine dehydrogenase Mo-binding subunit
MRAKSGSAARRWRGFRRWPAKAAGLSPEKVIVHNHLIGGGFGRRLEADGVVRAVEIAKHVDGPVKVVWTREEDIQHDMYRPYWFDRLPAGLDGVVCALDCGAVVNPDTVRAQIQRAIVFGITAALHGDRRAEWGSAGLRQSSRRSPMQSLRRPASGCARCPSTPQH